MTEESIRWNNYVHGGTMDKLWNMQVSLMVWERLQR